MPTHPPLARRMSSHRTATRWGAKRSEPSGSYLYKRQRALIPASRYVPSGAPSQRLTHGVPTSPEPPPSIWRSASSRNSSSRRSRVASCRCTQTARGTWAAMRLESSSQRSSCSAHESAPFLRSPLSSAAVCTKPMSSAICTI
eukprot:scaffold77653_cov30-Tisochrysis_lutea.AAC.2